MKRDCRIMRRRDRSMSAGGLEQRANGVGCVPSDSVVIVRG